MEGNKHAPLVGSMGDAIAPYSVPTSNKGQALDSCIVQLQFEKKKNSPLLSDLPKSAHS